MRVIISPHPCLTIFHLKNYSHPNEYEVVLKCVDLMNKDVKHIFVCFLAICISSWEMRLSTSFVQLLIGLSFVIELCEFFLVPGY